MQMKTSLGVLLPLILPLSGCDQLLTDLSQSPLRPIYSNSFESPSDTIGWSGYGSLQRFPSAPEGGGAWSARVSGGCIVPHACTKIRIQTGGGRVSLLCWGKNLAIGGGVELYKTNDPSARISVQITETVWTHYRSSASLACSANDTLEIAMNSGGIVYSAMLIDILEIRRVP